MVNLVLLNVFCMTLKLIEEREKWDLRWIYQCKLILWRRRTRSKIYDDIDSDGTVNKTAAREAIEQR